MSVVVWEQGEMVLAPFIGIYPGFTSTKGQGRSKEGPEGQNLGRNWIFPPQPCPLVGSVTAPAAELGALLQLGFRSFSSLCSGLKPWMSPSLQAGIASCVFCCILGKTPFLGAGGGKEKEISAWLEGNLCISEQQNLPQLHQAKNNSQGQGEG